MVSTVNEKGLIRYVGVVYERSRDFLGEGKWCESSRKNELG